MYVHIKMQCPSISFIFSKVFLTYIIYSIYTLSLLFVVPSCEKGKPCLKSYLYKNPQLQLYIYSSIMKHPSIEREVNSLYMQQNFDYTQTQNISLSIDLPRKTQKNGTLFLHVILVPSSQKQFKSFKELQKDIFMTNTIIELTQYSVPEAKVFNLLGEQDETVRKKEKYVHPITHIKSKVTFTIMTEDIGFPKDNVPVELINDLRILNGNIFLPIINYDFLQTRHHDLLQISPQNKTVNVSIIYTPITLGKLRLMLHVEDSMQSLKNLGFSDKDIDEIKGIFADTNIYLLGGTFFIAAIHILIDFLAFKNDVNFWRRKNNLAGLSKWSVVWRAFSQIVIFLYLLEENSSLLILIPTGIGTIIELWKLKKILRIEVISYGGIFPRIRFNEENINVVEKKTREFDSESMRYLSYLLYPLVIGAALYSLIYQHHKSWYSWTINSLVNGVYAFGFLFMLPQLFINYKLKSVAHLPWRAFMYKAFNTFIDDIFAFIITMPTAHRIACFRDDAVFLIYLYQRWLYAVDKSRIDTDSITEEPIHFKNTMKKIQ
ncbi:cleft lip and palate transmembrane protein 1-like protein isoform X1 [Vespula pensylvanica]|uniref:cleft lip and palate transmembrane protein 1-like protein isoform X1 n=1 Tax=Vespula pensylvanica TaxID=30213 RepID=UPI001CBA52CA|nr:cleft lip and palate transmembrane protein 1-like protein isoform X1 [Vespula pensylvanica]